MKILIRIGFDICGFLLFTLLASYALGILFYPLYKSKITAKFFIVYNSCLLGLVVILFTIAFFHILTNNTLTVWGFGTPTLLVGTVDITVGVGFTPINITFAYLEIGRAHV